MDRKSIEENLRTYTAIDAQQMDLFFQLAEEKTLSKNTFLIEQNQFGSCFTYVKSGCLMTYYSDKDCNPHVIQFGTSKWWTGDLQAFVNKSQSSYTIKVMDDSEVMMFTKDNFDRLCREAPSFERYFRILFQNSLVSHQKRIIRNISYTAEKKYQHFVGSYPKLELVVPQKYIASYLGITPEFLSKIKRKLSGR